MTFKIASWKTKRAGHGAWSFGPIHVHKVESSDANGKHLGWSVLVFFSTERA
jgi:hypothetical protein